MTQNTNSRKPGRLFEADQPSLTHVDHTEAFVEALRDNAHIKCTGMMVMYQDNVRMVCATQLALELIDLDQVGLSHVGRETNDRKSSFLGQDQIHHAFSAWYGWHRCYVPDEYGSLRYLWSLNDGYYNAFTNTDRVWDFPELADHLEGFCKQARDDGLDVD